MVELERDITIPSSDDIITINMKLGGSVLNRGMIDFVIAKIEAKVPKRDYKRQIATIAAVFWFEIISQEEWLQIEFSTFRACLYKPEDCK